MRVLIIGGTGNISSSLTRQCVAAGHETVILNRGNREVITGARTIAVDTRDEAAVGRVLGTTRWDCVLDFIAFTPEDVARDCRLFNRRTAQYVFISSASAYQKPLQNHVISEATPLINPFWDYARDKIACEEACLALLRDQGFPAVIVRPSLTYDTVIPVPIGGWTEFTIIERMRRGAPVVVHGDGTSLWTLTHAEDLSRALFGLIGNPQTVGEAFHITSDEVLTWEAIYQEVASAAGATARLVHVPSDLIAAIEPRYRGTLHGDKCVSAVFDNSKIKRFVPGWKARIPFSVGIRRTLAWFEADPRRQVVRPTTNEFIDRCIAAMRAAYQAVGQELP